MICKNGVPARTVSDLHEAGSIYVKLGFRCLLFNTRFLISVWFISISKLLLLTEDFREYRVLVWGSTYNSCYTV